MDINWKCDECGKPLITDSKHAGAQLECPKCKKSLVVPSSQAESQRRGKMKEVFKGIGSGLAGVGGCLVGIIFFVGAILITIIIIEGGAWLGEKIFPWLVRIAGLTIAITIFALLPLAIFKKTRGFSGTAIVWASYVIGLTLWFWGFLLTYMLWGVGALIIGLFFFGVGVVFIAVLATLFNGMWSVLGQLILLLVITFGLRFLGFYLIGKGENINQLEEPIEPEWTMEDSSED